MTISFYKKWLFLIMAIIGFAAQAGVIRSDRSDALYTGLAADGRYQSVGDMIINGNTRCSGTAIAGEWVLTAAHCLSGSVSSVTFSVGGHIYSGISGIVNSNWTGDLSTGEDIALLKLSQTIIGITFAQLYTGTAELGVVGTNVGFGTTGTGTTGYNSPSGTKRAGQNMIDATGAIVGWSNDILLQDFDNPTNVNDNLIGSSTPLNLEYLIAPGDSGGGLFADIGGTTYIVGIHSFIASVDGLTNADYGDFSGSTRVSSFAHWINWVIPVPNTLWLMGAGILLLINMRVRFGA